MPSAPDVRTFLHQLRRQAHRQLDRQRQRIQADLRPGVVGRRDADIGGELIAFLRELAAQRGQIRQRALIGLLLQDVGASGPTGGHAPLRDIELHLLGVRNVFVAATCARNDASLTAAVTMLR